MKKPFTFIFLIITGYFFITSFNAGMPENNCIVADLTVFKSRVLEFQNSDLAKTEQDLMALSYAASNNSLLLFEARMDDFSVTKIGRAKLKDVELFYACSVNDLATFKSRLQEFQNGGIDGIDVSRGALY